MIFLTAAVFCAIAYVWITMDSQQDVSKAAIRVHTDEPKPRRNTVVND